MQFEDIRYVDIRDCIVYIVYLVKKEGNKALACLLLPVRVDPHEPVRGSVFGADAEDPRLELLAVLHLHLLGKVGDAPGVVVLGVRLVVSEGPAGGHDGRLPHPRGGGLLPQSSTVAGVGHHSVSHQGLTIRSLEQQQII